MGDEPNPPDILYHYCKNEVFLSIIENDEKGRIHLSDLNLSNDSQEGRWVKRVFEKYYRTHGVSENHIDAALREIDLTIDMIGAAGFCMSERDDTLSQWRAYADDGFGVAIGFSAQHFVDVSDIAPKDGRGFRLKKILYKEGEQAAAISEVADKIMSCIKQGWPYSQYRIPQSGSKYNQASSTNNNHELMLYADILLLGKLYTVKNPAFSEEAEWRLVSFIVGRGAEWEPSSDLKSMEFRALRDRIVPFRTLPLRHEGQSPIKRVVLGPRNITPISVVKGFLAKHGHEEVEVVLSEASYR
jgi:hypothetical protein